MKRNLRAPSKSKEVEYFLVRFGFYFLPGGAAHMRKHAHVLTDFEGMDFEAKWSNLPEGPSLKNLTDGTFGSLKECQHSAIQDLTRAHIDSFDQAVTDGLGRVVQV